MNLIFLGDSLIELCDWQARFPAHRVANLGRAGETVEELLARAPQLVGSRPAPDRLLIMSGTNNLAMEDYGFPRVYEELLPVLKTGFPETSLAVNSLLPMQLPWLPLEAVKRMNEQLRTMAGRQRVLFLDAFAPFLAADPSLASLLLPDGVHLSAAGYDLWSRQIAAALDL